MLKSCVNINGIGEIKGGFFYVINPEVGLGQGRLVIRCRREEQILTRMRIGHTGLNKTLQLIGKHESGNCSICNVPETLEHVFMMCKKFKRERVLMKRKSAVFFFELVIIKHNISGGWR